MITLEKDGQTQKIGSAKQLKRLRDDGWAVKSIIVAKGARTQRLMNDTQLAAFLKGGWTLDETSKPSIEKPVSAESIEALKKEADALGIDYQHNIGVEKLREKINAATNSK